jgi:hypothetical protein
MWQKRRAQRAWTMVVTVVLEPITRICPDSGSGLGGVGVEAGEVSFESLNMEHFLKESIVTNMATKLFYPNDTDLVTFTLSYTSDKI